MGDATHCLTRMGQSLCWIVYLFIGYASLVAYTSGGGKEISFVFTELFHLPFSNTIGSVLFLLIFGGIIYLGYEIVERVNSILFIRMIIAFLFMIGLAPKNIHLDLLNRQNSSFLLLIF